MELQLTVNFVALVVAFVAAVGSGETPLNVLQLLWVNLIMDSLGALGESLDVSGGCVALDGSCPGCWAPVMWQQLIRSVVLPCSAGDGGPHARPAAAEAGWPPRVAHQPAHVVAHPHAGAAPAMCVSACPRRSQA